MVQQRNKYLVYEIDLIDLHSEEEKDFKLGDPIFEYASEDVHNRQLICFHARGSSKKEMFDTNENLFIFFLHNGFLYSWTKYSSKFSQQGLKLVCSVSTEQFYVLNENVFFFFENETDPDGKILLQNVIRLQVNYS